MSEIPSELKYVATHEWLRLEADGSVVVGITDHAQHALGDLVFVEAPMVGSKLAADQACGVVESVKAASDLYAPIAGEVIAINPALADSPELINSEPYEGGWIWRMTPSQPAQLDALLDASGYRAALED